MSDNLYDRLKVSSIASPDEIKRAFREQAKRWHPDMQDGDAEFFTQIEFAYTVLIDPERRAYYDKHGTAPMQPLEVNENAALYNVLQQAMIAAIGSVTDISRCDLLMSIEQILSDHKNRIVADMAGVKAQLAKIKAAVGRTKKKTGDNMLAAIMQPQIDAHEKKVAEGEGLIALDEKAIEFLKEYNYNFNKVRAHSGANFFYEHEVG